MRGEGIAPETGQEGRMSRVTTAIIANVLGNAREDERGQTLIEYTLILFLVSIIGIALLKVIGFTVRDFIGEMADGL